MKRFQMTEAAARAHQSRHFGKDIAAPPAPAEAVESRMNKTETAFSLILEAMKRKKDIISYQFEGISLPWGLDPKTGKVMWYTPDFFVIKNAFRQNIYMSDVLIIEVKGPHIREKDWIRFKGCRSDWPMFTFEFHQKQRGGEWRKVA